jgi:uncharacterized RDD family membrane protein YckC
VKSYQPISAESWVLTTDSIKIEPMTIEITTTQNVTIEYELAELRERFFALLIDTLVMIAFWIGLVFLTLSVIKGTGMGRFWEQILASFPIWYLLVYNFSCETLLNGQTIGKRAQNIKVVRLDGNPVGLSDILLRAVLQLLDYLLTLGALGALLISTTERRQRLGDMAAGTTVVRLAKGSKMSLYDILNIQSLENYTPQYSQVKQLSEEDMLFIKSVIQRYQQHRNGSHEDAVESLFQHLKTVLEIQIDLHSTPAQIDFLKTLIKDYIVLTR